MSQSNYLSPPTFVSPIIVNSTTGQTQFSPIWLAWFVQLAQLLSKITGSGGAIAHNTLSGLQGGTPAGGGQYYHLTQAQATLVAQMPNIGNVPQSASVGPITYTLPLSTSNVNFMLNIWKSDSSANHVTIATTGSDTISGLATYVLTTQWQAVMLVSDGAGHWVILGHS